VKGRLRRKPAHLNDRSASVYQWPHFEPDSDVITDAGLSRLAGPVDVAGGWADAGDYLKFVHSSAYNDVVLLATERNLAGKAPKSLGREARHGTHWLTKMWDARTKTLYLQVGIGSGNDSGTFLGDHDLWRLPQADDHDTAHQDRFVAHRPVFEAARPGHKISPNLVGRVSAAFALSAQVDAKHHDLTRARHEFAEATSLYAMAATANPPEPLTTALPNAFYPEDTWRDDMELGATQITLAALLLHRPAGDYLKAAARWAKGYIAHDTGDTFNLYDTSALAHVDLVRAIGLSGDPTGLAVTKRALLADLRRQIGSGVRHARSDPFRAAGDYDDFDVDSHTFGLIASVGWYRSLTGDHRFDTFTTEQRNWLFGANAWGASFMVGEGHRFPHCMQHQVANLGGTTDGRPPLDAGAVVNGPNGRDVFDSAGLGGYQDGMVKCPPSGHDGFAEFNGRGSRYVDDVRSWQTDEPALDMTAAAIAAAGANLMPRASSRLTPNMHHGRGDDGVHSAAAQGGTARARGRHART
jgi:endoglucanase